MPIHIEELTSEVAMADEGSALSEHQLQQIVERVIRCLDERQRSQRWSRDATALRRSVQPRRDERD